jgi:nitric oxide dioxygenase
LGVLKSAIDRIAEKHLSLNVVPEHYSIVGEHLIGAIKEVLGEAATPEIISAWTEAYTFLADVFITKEQQIREDRAKSAGGWTGIREFAISSKKQENISVMTIQLRPTDGGAIPHWKAGQYIGLREAVSGSETIQRNYSLSCVPQGEYLEIAVKRQATPNQPAGQISTFLHDLPEGSVLHVSVPCGTFVLDHTKVANPDLPIVLLGVGIGITPIYPIAVHALEKYPNPLVIIHGSKNEEEHTFSDRFRELKEKYPGKFSYIELFRWPIDQTVRKNHTLSFQTLKEVIPAQGLYYFCGPDAWMQEIAEGLEAIGNPKERINFQFFSPSLL